MPSIKWTLANSVGPDQTPQNAASDQGSTLFAFRTGIAMSRKEGNDQESVQLPNAFRPRHQRERRAYLKQWHHNQHYRQKAKKAVSFQKIGRTAVQNKQFSKETPAKTYNDRISKPQSIEVPPWNG